MPPSISTGSVCAFIGIEGRPDWTFESHPSYWSLGVDIVEHAPTYAYAEITAIAAVHIAAAADGVRMASWGGGACPFHSSLL